MRKPASVTIVLLLSFIFPSLALAQPIIEIDSIIKDSYINGNVSNITAEARSNHKIIVYVKTDKWYIHPYASGGDGRSWASIQDNGTWKIETTYRGFPASQIAALLVKRDAGVPSPIYSLEGIPRESELIKTLEGTPDFGKL